MPDAPDTVAPREKGPQGLPLPAARCLTAEQAATYLAIGVTLLAELDVPCVKLGRRRVYDKVDLDGWLDEHKRRGRARKETEWPEKADSTGGAIRASGGSTWYYPAADAYASALGLHTEPRRKPSSQD
jgi:hypothetical protein